MTVVNGIVVPFLKQNIVVSLDCIYGAETRERVLEISFMEKSVSKKYQCHLMEIKGEMVLEIHRRIVVILPKISKVIVIINPFGGRKKGELIYRKRIEPILKKANVERDIHLTTGMGDAFEYLKKGRWDSYEALMVIGGDGLLHECINGLIKNASRNVSTLSICAIPAGTSNAVARSLGLVDPLQATLRLLQRRIKPRGLLCYDLGREEKIFGIMAMMWGLLADIDLEGDSYRWMGRLRLYLSSLMRICRMRKYAATLKIIPIKGQAEPLEINLSRENYSCFLATIYPWLDKDIVISQKETIDGEAIDIFLIPSARISRGKLLTSLFTADVARLHDDPRMCRHYRAGECCIEFAPDNAPVLDIDGEDHGFAQKVTIKHIPNMVQLVCDDRPV